ncbi:50S ribosomal protein L29 [Acidobacteriota bacterium]
MKSTEIREFTEEELVTKEAELKDQLFKLKFQHTLGQLENSVKMKNVRRDIARIKTILTEKSKSKGKGTE